MELTPVHQHANRGAPQANPRTEVQKQAGEKQKQKQQRRSIIKNRKEYLNICTYNTRTLSDEHLDNFHNELESGIKSDINTSLA